MKIKKTIKIELSGDDITTFVRGIQESIDYFNNQNNKVYTDEIQSILDLFVDIHSEIE